MAERRMFTMKIVDSDAFLDMPLSAQALYFHLNMRADDDGFVNNPKKIQRMIGANDDDLKVLIAKRFVLAFESGIVVIKHWRMHNLLRKDRYHPTQYQDEIEQLNLKDNGAYTEQPKGLATTWQPSDNQMATEDSIGKYSKGNCCSNKGEVDFFELLSDEQIAQLKSIYQDHYELLDECQDDANRKHKAIRNPYEYIVGYAHNKGWPER